MFKRIFAVCSVLSLCFIQPVLSQAAKPAPTADLTDPAGDVPAGKKDVVKVSLSSDGKSLHIVTMLKDDIAKYVNKDVMAPSTIVELNLDTDNNPATGGVEMWTKKKGFEYQIEVSGCIEYEGGSSACAGGAGSKIKSFFSVAEVEKYTKAGDTSTDNVKSAWDVPHTTFTGNRVEESVPYTEFGGHSGQVIRVAIRESDAGYDESSLMPDVLLQLK